MTTSYCQNNNYQSISRPNDDCYQLSTSSEEQVASNSSFNQRRNDDCKFNHSSYHHLVVRVQLHKIHPVVRATTTIICLQVLKNKWQSFTSYHRLMTNNIHFELSRTMTTKLSEWQLSSTFAKNVPMQVIEDRQLSFTKLMRQSTITNHECAAMLFNKTTLSQGIIWLQVPKNK